jgi:hypothetical protein
VRAIKVLKIIHFYFKYYAILFLYACTCPAGGGRLQVRALVSNYHVLIMLYLLFINRLKMHAETYITFSGPIGKFHYS